MKAEVQWLLVRSQLPSVPAFAGLYASAMKLKTDGVGGVGAA